MVLESKPATEATKPLSDRVIARRGIFVSHTHADRKLVSHLRDVVQGAFSGLVETWDSSDPSATGGFSPGDEWFQKIHERLSIAEAVWILATPSSITRPWIYWEAGIGRSLCRGGVVVLRVGVDISSLPSPLNAFQSYDGLSDGEDGILVLLRKAGGQLGMAIPEELLVSLASKWLAAARQHQPEVVPDQKAPLQITPEQVSRVESAILRLEAIASRRDSVDRRPHLPTRLISLDDPRMQSERDLAAEAAEAGGASGPFGGWTSPFIMSQRELDLFLSELPSDTSVRSRPIDRDGDIPLMGSRGSQVEFVYVRGDWARGLVPDTYPPGRDREIVLQILAALN